MQIYQFDPADDVNSQITGWAQAKYGNAQPALTSYAAREGGYSDSMSNVAGLSAPPTAAATPSSWSSATAQPTTAQPSSWDAFKAAHAPGVGTTYMTPSKLATREVDASKETVAGQINSLMAENSPVLQQARNDALRTANERGMLNSSMAASGGTDAVIRSAAQIGSQDASTWSNAADYNTALKNQAAMYNADQENQATRLYAQLQADAASRAQALELARMQDATSRWQTEQQFARQSDETRKSLANNIIQNMDLSPDRKAAMLEQIGEGRMAGYDANGNYVPGYGLAGAVYVIESTSGDLNFSGGASRRPVLGMNERPNGPIGQMLYDAGRQGQERRDREGWGSGRSTNSSDYYYYQQ